MLTLSALSESYIVDIVMRDINGLYVVADPIHVQKLFARESGEPAINLDMVQVRIENPIGVQQW